MDNKFFKLIRHNLRWLFYFSRYAVKQFYEQRGLQNASSLAYTTLLSLVPLITVMFSFLKGMPVFANMGESIREFAFDNFAPAFGESVQIYIQDFADKAGDLTTTGIILLIIIALMLIATIDNTFNHIWHIKKRRKATARFLVYWAILTLGPVLVGAGLFITSYLFSLSVILDIDESFGFRQQVFPLLPFITTGIAFTLLYLLVPNCYVSRRHAIIGGTISAALFELAKYGFGAYVKTFSAYQAIYGAIAVIPIFLIWIYISWVIVILGAHITFCLSSFRYVAERSGRKDVEWHFLDVCRVISVLWMAQKEGGSLSIPELRKHLPRIPFYQINEILETLESQHWVYRESGGSWLLSRDISGQTLLDIYRVVPNRMPLQDVKLGEEHMDKQLSKVLDQYHDRLEELLSIPVKSVLQ